MHKELDNLIDKLKLNPLAHMLREDLEFSLEGMSRLLSDKWLEYKKTKIELKEKKTQAFHVKRDEFKSDTACNKHIDWEYNEDITKLAIEEATLERLTERYKGYIRIASYLKNKHFAYQQDIKRD